MRCLYCGKHLALFRKLTGGGEFCSDAHRDKYQEEYNRLAVSRLLQAQTRPDEVKKPSKRKSESTPAAATNGGGSAVVVETEEPEIEVVAFRTEFFRQDLSPAAPVEEWMPVEYEPVPSLNSPKLALAPEFVRPALEPAAMQPRVEAGFPTLCPQPRLAGGDLIGTASYLTAEVKQVFPILADSQLAVPGLAEAAPITSDSLPAAGKHTFEPLTPGVQAVEFARPEPVAATTDFSPAVNDFSTAGLAALTLISVPPEDGVLEVETTALPFHYLRQRHPSFASGLTLLPREAETDSDPEPVEAPLQVLNGIASARPEPLPEQALEAAEEPTIVTPRRVLEVLSRMHGDGRESPLAEQQQPAALPVPVVEAADEEPPPALQTLKPVTIPALAPSPAALTPGFPSIVIAIQPRLLPYIPLPLRPKMAVGNALGPRVARNGGARSAGGRKGPADSPRTMTRSMLHLEEHGSAETDNEAETPKLFGKLGGLFGKKHKNH